MAYSSLSEVGVAVDELKARAREAGDTMANLAERVAELRANGSKALAEDLACLARKVEALEMPAPCLSPADVGQVIQSTAAAWRELETSCAELAGKGICYRRCDTPEAGVYVIRFFRPAATGEPAAPAP